MRLPPEERAYVRYRLGRAREALEEARLLQEAGHLATAVTRIYYACFYAVSALLLSEGRGSTKHGGVRALFDRYWVKPGRISKDRGRFYREMFERRQESDYVDLVSYEPEEVAGWRSQAEGFVEEIARLVEKALREQEEQKPPSDSSR